MSIFNYFKKQFRYYHYTCGKIMRKEQWQYNKLNGECVGYYDNDRVCFTRYYKGNKKHGEEIIYFKDGQLKEKRVWRKDNLIQLAVYKDSILLFELDEKAIRAMIKEQTPARRWQFNDGRLTKDQPINEKPKCNCGNDSCCG